MPKIRDTVSTLIDLVLAVYLYLALEWLFFVTKPSFFTVMPWTERFTTGLVAALPAVFLLMAAWVCCALLALLTSNLLSQRIRAGLLRLPQALVLTMVVVLLADNFTYTVFKLGIKTTAGVWIFVYLATVLVVFAVILKKISQQSLPSPARALAKRALSLGLPAMGLLTAFLMLQSSGSLPALVASATPDRPNILFFSTDGLETKFVSGFDHKRETTPYLDALIETSWVFDTALPNASRTTGSTVSMLTGKYPATTKVIFPPHTLIGIDAFQHLPGMLRSIGYSVFQESIRYYGDGPDLNMQLGFDVANRREVPQQSSKWLSDATQITFASPLYFLGRLHNRVVERMAHLVHFKSMDNAFESIQAGESARAYGTPDRTRISAAKEFIRTQEGPFMMHLHLMDTHCCTFKPKIRRFSVRFDKQESGDHEDFFRDAVLDSDAFFGEILESLEQAGKLENTLIIYSSDHSKGWNVRERVPLVIHFPDQKRVGRVPVNVQLMDLAPTVLDYLGISVPVWMEGDSLLSDALDPLRPIYSIAGVNREHVEREGDLVSQLVGEGPPMFGVKSMVMSVCQNWYALDLLTGEVQKGHINRHPQPCDVDRLPDVTEARESIVQHLSERGFSLPVESYPPLD